MKWPSILHQACDIGHPNVAWQLRFTVIECEYFEAISSVKFVFRRYCLVTHLATWNAMILI